jgi:hypothetical protein
VTALHGVFSVDRTPADRVAVPKRLGSSPSAVGAKRLEHFQEKWPPVFRRKCDQISNLDRLAGDAEGARRARTVAAPSPRWMTARGCSSRRKAPFVDLNQK